jgi:hypothetical protein
MIPDSDDLLDPPEKARDLSADVTETRAADDSDADEDNNEAEQGEEALAEAPTRSPSLNKLMRSSWHNLKASAGFGSFGR